ncbi:TIM barrel protein [Actinomadura parmotrematis]|uniref:TIM barrel protein n=1 Tax=Actinomadura parmotrematis TaxID=2864039 RepID=A0ABS7FSI2_9ACTN|nr:TIM barrel protein [Actinomadura parmotrematis]MBW8482532.1 TIM barrel protein [Actinomadura parmotrematis]
MRLAGAPISWGVCEVPGWGHQMAPGRVLAEMRALGLAATELGPDGYLPAGLPAAHGLAVAGAFAPAVLHDPRRDPLPAIRRRLAALPPGAVLVLAAATGRDGYDARPALDAAAWAALLANLDALRGRPVALHPHVGTVVQDAAEVRRVLDGCGVPLCLDTGHLLIGGTDPLDLARSDAGRIAHVHLKDVDAGAAARVRAGRVPYGEAVRAGLYRPLGAGDVDIAGIARALTGAGYGGWYVMEQDTVLDAEPPPGGGPSADVAAGLAYLAGATP